MAQHNANDDGEPGPTQVDRPDEDARASDVEHPDQGAPPVRENAGEPAPPGAGEQAVAPGAGANPWARPGSVPAAGEGSPAAEGTSADAPTGQHTVGHHAADQHAEGQHAEGQHAEGQFATDPNLTVPYAAGQYPAGQYQPGQYPPGQPQPGAFAAAGPPGAPYPAPYPGAPYPSGPYPGPGGPPGGARRSRGGRTIVLVAVGVVIALLAGGIGGVVGAGLARQSDSPPAVNGGVLAGPLPEVDPDQPLAPVEQVAARVLPSVVQIRVEGGTLSRGELGEGSGMIVSGDGLVLTNNHVVESSAAGGTARAVFQDGRTAPVRIIGRDPQSDIALVKVDNVTGLTPIELGNSDGVRVGQQVAAVGSPLGLGGSVTTGIISALNRAVSLGPESGATSPTVLSALQTDAAINPGNSGGPLVDIQGRVVGINSAIATAGPGGGSIGVGFAIPVNQAKRIADQLRTTGRATHAVLGVEVTDDPQQTGARLRTVDPAGPGGRAGLKVGDLVVRFGGRPVTSGEDLQAAVRSQVPGAVVEVQLSDRTTQVTLGEN